MPTDQRVVKFLNEQVRPACERQRAERARLASMLAQWELVKDLPDLTKGGGEVVDDGRELEGVSRLTGDDVTRAVEMLTKMHVIFSEIGAGDTLEKPCVRPLTVE